MRCGEEEPLHVLGSFKSPEVSCEFSLEGGYIDMEGVGVYDVSFFNVVGGEKRSCIEEAVKYRTHLLRVARGEATGLQLRDDEGATAAAANSGATSRLPSEPVTQVNNAGKFTMLPDGTVSCLFRDRTMLTLPFSETECSCVSSSGEASRVTLNAPDLGGPTSGGFEALKAYGRYLKVAREFKLWAVSTPEEVRSGEDRSDKATKRCEYLLIWDANVTLSLS